MKQYGLNTLEEMVQAIDQQEPIDIGIFVSPVKGSGIYEKQSANYYLTCLSTLFQVAVYQKREKAT